MAKLSIIIPSRNERFTGKTVNDLLTKAAGDIEVIVVLDGWWPDPPLPVRDNLITLHRGTPLGMRAAINGAASIAKGEYLMKCDGHCMFAEGFDEVLKANCDDNWLVVPRRNRLDAEAWTLQDVGKPPVDYEYLSCPITNRDGYSMHGAIWADRARSRMNMLIDDDMSFQGSCWFMTRKHWSRIGPMSEVGYGGFCQEPQELGLKTWLGGGAIKRNKLTWYAHLHKGKTYGRGYFQDKKEIATGHEYSARYWMGNQWPDRVHDIDWLIDRFWPVPTWPENWQSIRDEHVG